MVGLEFCWYHQGGREFCLDGERGARLQKFKNPCSTRITIKKCLDNQAVFYSLIIWKNCKKIRFFFCCR